MQALFEEHLTKGAMLESEDSAQSQKRLRKQSEHSETRCRLLLCGQGTWTAGVDLLQDLHRQNTT